MVKAVVSQTKLEGGAAVLGCVFQNCFPDVKLHWPTKLMSIHSFAPLLS